MWVKNVSEKWVKNEWKMWVKNVSEKYVEKRLLKMFLTEVEALIG